MADKVGFALAPDNGLGKRGNWLWAWSLGVPAGTKNADAAQKFISWATSKHYTDLVASKEGIANVPPGTRNVAVRQSRLRQDCAIRATDDRLDRFGRPDASDGQARALHRRTVRGDP